MPIKVTGLRELVKGLEEMGTEVTDLKDAFGKISAKAAQLGSSFAPKRSGRLASSVKGSKTKNKAVVKAGGARVPYTHAIHWGWKKRNISPNPFLRRADDAIRPDIVPMIEDGIGSILKEKGF